MQKRSFTVKEAAAYLGVAPQTIYNGISRRAKNPFPIQPRRLGSKPVFFKEDLDHYLDSLPRDGGRKT